MFKWFAFSFRASINILKFFFNPVKIKYYKIGLVNKIKTEPYLALDEDFILFFIFDDLIVFTPFISDSIMLKIAINSINLSIFLTLKNVLIINYTWY